MSTSLNSAGVAHAHALANAGKINDGTWSFSAEDGNAMLGSAGDDWPNYAKWFLATHPDQTANTKAHYGYPFGKNGEIYRNAVISAKGRAAQQGAEDIVKACSSLMDIMDAKAKKGAITSNRIYSLLEIRSIDEDARTFEGLATTPSTDRMDDIVEPMGAVFKLPIPILWQHGRGSITDPVGWVTDARPNANGIPVKVQMAKPGVDYPQALRDDLNKAWVLIRDKLVRGLSIGFNPIESTDIEGSWGRRYTKWEWLELSPVTIAANQDATIQTVKSFDLKQRGIERGERCSVVRLERSLLQPKPGVFRLPQTK